MSKEKTLDEEYPEFKRIIPQDKCADCDKSTICKTQIKEVLDKHFVRLNSISTKGMFIGRKKEYLSKKEVKDILDAYNMKEHHPNIYKKLGLK